MNAAIASSQLLWNRCNRTC